MSATRLALAIAIVLSVAGCSTVGNGRLVQLDAAQAQALLVPGTTTQADVRRGARRRQRSCASRAALQTWHYQTIGKACPRAGTTSRSST